MARIRALDAAEAGRHTPEALAAIAAERAEPTGFEIAMQEVDRAAEDAVREHREAQTVYGGARIDAVFPIDGPRCTHAMHVDGCSRCSERATVQSLLKAREDILAWQREHKDAIVLTGPDAERYRALQAAARAAQETTKAAQAASAALRDAFQQFCAGATP